MVIFLSFLLCLICIKFSIHFQNAVRNLRSHNIELMKKMNTKDVSGLKKKGKKNGRNTSRITQPQERIENKIIEQINHNIEYKKGILIASCYKF